MKKSENIFIENENLKINVLPEFGGKILKLIHKKTGTQFFKETLKKVDEIHPPKYGDDFLPPYAFGFDECFPNVSTEKIMKKGKREILPDHGELWNRPCEYEVQDCEVTLRYSGVVYDYLLQKKLKLFNNKLIIHYELINLQETSFDYIWSSHPLLSVEEGDSLIFNNQINEMILNWASNDELGSYKDQVNWPFLDRRNPERDFSVIQERSVGIAIKLFTKQNAVNVAGIYRHKSDESLLFSFDETMIPYLGIWLCYEGWPENLKTKDFTVALEPARGGLDLLSDAKRENKAFQIQPGEVHNWTIELSVERGKSCFKK